MVFDVLTAALEEARNKRDGHGREQHIDHRVAPLAGLLLLGEALVGTLQLGLALTLLSKAFLLRLDLLNAFFLRDAIGLDLGRGALRNFDGIAVLILGFRGGGNAFKSAFETQAALREHREAEEDGEAKNKNSCESGHGDR